MKYKWECLYGIVSIEIDADYDEYGNVVIAVSPKYDISATSKQSAINQVVDILKSSYGMFGHTLNPQRCCPCDMDYALMNLPEHDKRFLNPVLVEGERKTVNLDLPDGAMS